VFAFGHIGNVHAFWDLGGAVSLWAELREMQVNSSNVLAVPDPWEILAITSRLSQIDQVIMTWKRLRSDIKCSAIHIMN